MMTFEQSQAHHHEQNAIGAALAEAAFERGDRLTPMERQALTHWSRWGSDSYPVQKRGRGWTINHTAASGAPIYKTKTQAVNAWEILIAKWVRMSGLEAHAETINTLGTTR